MTIGIKIYLTNIKFYMLISNYISSSFSASSYSHENFTSLSMQQFDFALLSSSWDQRCTTVTEFPYFKAKHIALILPINRDTDGFRDRNDLKLMEFSKNKSESFSKHELDTRLIQESWLEIKTEFNKFLNTKFDISPLSVYIDSSACPRFLSLALLKYAMSTGLCQNITIGYREGKYPVKPKSYRNIAEIAFAEGSFTATTIPGYLGDYNPSKKKIYIVSLGFDGNKTLNLIAKKEPDRVAVILASPGVLPEYELRTRSANSTLITKYVENDDDIIKCDVGDAVKVLQSLSKLTILEKQLGNIYFLGAGNKAHSIGMALASIDMTYTSMLYNLPLKHKPVKVLPGSKFWTYEIVPLHI